MTVRAIILCLLLFSVAEAQHLHAAEIGAANNGQSSLETVQQKLQLLKTLLSKSPAVERATHSENETVRQKIVSARAIHAKASNELGAGNTARADELLDEALQLIESASRQSPDPLQPERDQRKHYTELLEGLHNLQATYHDLSLHLSPKAGLASPGEPDRVPGMIDQAQTLARNHHYREAAELLNNAHSAIIAALNKLLKSTALMYDSKFKSPVEEFDYEMARYLSYEELIPIAYAELNPGEESIKISARFVQESREMRDRARQQAASGDLPSAIASLNEAVKHLQAALRMAGLVLPE